MSSKEPFQQPSGQVVNAIRTATVITSLTGIVALLCLAGVSGDLKKMNWGELVFASLFFTFPSVFLACLGYRRTTSTALSTILLLCSMLSTALWILVAWSFAAAGAIDAQSGLAVVFVILIQLGIVVVAGVSFLFLARADEGPKGRIRWSIRLILTLLASLIACDVLFLLGANFGEGIGGDVGEQVMRWLGGAIGLVTPWIIVGLRHRKFSRPGSRDEKANGE